MCCAYTLNNKLLELIFRNNFLSLILAKCVRMKVVEEIFRQLLQKVWCLWRKQIYMYIDEDFAIIWIRPKFLSFLSCPRHDNGLGIKCYLCPSARTHVRTYLRTYVRLSNDFRSLSRILLSRILWNMVTLFSTIMSSSSSIMVHIERCSQQLCPFVYENSPFETMSAL